MKRSELFFGALLVPIDYLSLLLAGAIAYYLRTSEFIQSVRPAIFELDLPLLEYMQLAGIVSIVIICIFALQGLYIMQVTRRPVEEVTRIFSGVSIGFILIILYSFLSAELFQSRFILLAAYVFSLILITAGRYFVKRVQIFMVGKGYGIHRTVLVGNGRYGQQLANFFHNKSEKGYHVVGELAVPRWDMLEELYREKGIDELIQTDPTLPEEDNLVLLDFCDKYKIDYKYVPNTFESHAAHVRFRQIAGVPTMELLRTPLEGWGRVSKRAVDIFGAIFGIIVLSPILIATAIAIKLDSCGDIFYKQVRVGKNTKPFKIYKFRSMFIDTCTGDEYGGAKASEELNKLREKTNERTGPLFKMKNDPRITHVGKVIRKLRIDELPQFINVLKGEMSLLGPRPHLPEEVAKYDKHHQKLFTIKPGMSGMAQVNGNAGLTFEQEANLDISYIEGWSLKLDFILLVKTFVLLLKDKNAV